MSHDKKNHYFIRQVIDKTTKIKSKCCRGGGLNQCPLIINSPTTLIPRPRRFVI